MMVFKVGLLKLLLSTLLIFNAVQVDAKSKPVIANLSTKWKNTPIIQEARYGYSINIDLLVACCISVNVKQK